MRSCSIDGCEKPVDARGWCQMHYWRWKTHGDPLLTPGKRFGCEVGGCLRSHSKNGLCSLHGQRMKRNGSTDSPVTVLDSKRYRLVKSVGHPLAHNGTGRVYAHRKVLFDAIGPVHVPCFWCSIPLAWWSEPDCELICVDHLDHDRHNNALSNLVPSCGHCNVRRTRRLRVQPTSCYEAA